MISARINKEGFKKAFEEAQKEGKSEFLYRNIPFKVEYAKCLLEVMETNCNKSLAVSYSQLISS